MYKARNGFTLRDAATPGGWHIQCAQDIITALLDYPYFQPVYESIIWEAIGNAVGNRKEYDNIDDLARHLAKHYI